jgi:uncharacterized protein (TIGR02271 family)
MINPNDDRDLTGSRDLTGDRNLTGDREMLAGSEGRSLENEEQRLTLAEEQLAVGKRSVEAGEVHVGKTVETRHVEESVPLRHDEVTIERRPVADGMRADAVIGDQEIRVPLRQEEAVAEKRVVANEELVVRRHEVEREEQVGAELRRERAEIHREGDVEVRGDSTGMVDRDDRNRGL